LVFPEHQVHFYTLPSLDPVHTIKPIRNVVTIAVDHQHLQRPPPSLSDPPSAVAPIEFSVIKRSNIALYSLRDKLSYQKVTFKLLLSQLQPYCFASRKSHYHKEQHWLGDRGALFALQTKKIIT
jgi:hypothetical protein